MVDTLNIYQPADRIKGIDILSEISCYLTERKHGDDMKFITGKLDNYHITLSEKGISLKGSISTFTQGNNFNLLSGDKLKLGIEELSDRLHIRLMDAKVSRFDIASNLIMEHPPEAYYPYMGKHKTYERNSGFPHTLYYNGSLIKIAFYNKVVEAKKDIPKELIDKNFLRYELGFMKSPMKYFNLQIVTPALLCDERFQRRLVIDYKKQYDSIPKLKKVLLHPANPISPNDVIPYLALQGIEDNGGLIATLTYLDTLTYTHKEYKSRARRLLRAFANNPKYITAEPLIEELDRKMKDQFLTLMAA